MLTTFAPRAFRVRNTPAKSLRIRSNAFVGVVIVLRPERVVCISTGGNILSSTSAFVAAAAEIILSAVLGAQHKNNVKTRRTVATTSTTFPRASTLGIFLCYNDDNAYGGDTYVLSLPCLTYSGTGDGSIHTPRG